MRNLADVIDSLLEHIPDTEKDLIYDLNSVRSSVAYSPPENMMLWWGETLLALSQKKRGRRLNKNKK